MKQFEKYLKKCHKSALKNKENKIYNPATISCFSKWNNSNAILKIPEEGIYSISHKTADNMIYLGFVQEQFNGTYNFDLSKYEESI